MNNLNQCSEHETATTRGRMPAHEVHLFQKMLFCLLSNKREKQLLRRKMGIKGLKANANPNSSMESHLFKLLNSHYYSYDKNARLKKEHPLPPLRQRDIFNKHTSHDFYYASGF